MHVCQHLGLAADGLDEVVDEHGDDLDRIYIYIYIYIYEVDNTAIKWNAGA
jgi:hypothetical protein